MQERLADLRGASDGECGMTLEDVLHKDSLTNLLMRGLCLHGIPHICSTTTRRRTGSARLQRSNMENSHRSSRSSPTTNARASVPLTRLKTHARLSYPRLAVVLAVVEADPTRTNPLLSATVNDGGQILLTHRLSRHHKSYRPPTRAAHETIHTPSLRLLHSSSREQSPCGPRHEFQPSQSRASR